MRKSPSDAYRPVTACTEGLNDRRDGAGDTKLDTRRVGACQPDRYAAGSSR